MTSDPVLYAVEDGATITLNRPDKANTLRTAVTDGLNEHLAAANRDDQAKVIVLEGAGDNLCGARLLLEERLKLRNLCGHPAQHRPGREETVIFIEGLALNILGGTFLNW